jgi:preprotein translocase subunit SecD
MKANARRFNLFLALMALAVFCGCQTSSRNKPVSVLRVHMQAPGMTATSKAVSVLRADPVLVNIAQEPVLTEANIVAARVIDAPGGFAIQIQFDENGTWILEQYSAANPGKHFAIFGQWGEQLADVRWLAAPLITRRIADGILSFTPDATREEADRLVLGLNNVAKKIHKGQLK